MRFELKMILAVGCLVPAIGVVRVQAKEKYQVKNFHVARELKLENQET